MNKKTNNNNNDNCQKCNEFIDKKSSIKNLSNTSKRLSHIDLISFVV